MSPTNKCSLELTEHISWSGVHPKEVLIIQSLREPYEQARTTFKPRQMIILRMLHSLGQHLHRDLLQPRPIDLTRLRGVAAEQARLEHLQTGDGQALAA